MLGEAGRAILEHDQAFDVILCDMMMPEMTGMALHEWLAMHHPALAARGESGSQGQGRTGPLAPS
jgi:CheY-like chemotaxis protein